MVRTLTICMMLIFVSSAAAQDKEITTEWKSQYKDSYNKGLELFNLGRYEEAVDPLKDSLKRLHPDANIYLGLISEILAEKYKKAEYFCEAMDYYWAAAKGDLALGWYLLGFGHERGICGECNYEKAYSSYRRSIQRESLNLAHLRLGDLYMYGRGTEMNKDKALYHFGRAAELGAEEAKYNIAMLLYETDPKQKWNDKTMVAILEEAGEGGVAKAWYKLGELYHYGKLSMAEPGKAMQYYQRASDGGRKEAAHSLADLFADYPYLDPDGKKLEKALISCIQDGDADAARKLAELYINADLLDQNIPKARELLEFAIKGKDAEACFVLGKLYWDGQHIEKDTEKALELIRRAKSSGSRQAREFLNKM